jgi:hypothetical protein
MLHRKIGAIAHCAYELKLCQRMPHCCLDAWPPVDGEAKCRRARPITDFAAGTAHPTAARSAVQAGIHSQQLDAWLQGAPACDEPGSLTGLQAGAAALGAASISTGRGQSGAPPPHLNSRQQQQQQQQQQQEGQPRLQLFGLNDYLGLSTHPDVCRAAAEAALAVRRAHAPQPRAVWDLGLARKRLCGAWVGSLLASHDVSVLQT